ncbi:MAG: putative lipid II flippase FtsW [Pseudomonadales bacterium]|nr:putative lipid II flippase FtsW [Pseudomonadales bacterium]
MPFSLLPQHKPGFSTEHVDTVLLAVVVVLVSLGLVMVSSASIDYSALKLGDPFYFAKRHFIYICMGFTALLLVAMMPVAFWQRHATLLLFIGVVILALVLVPGIGRKVNGSQRWVSLGGFTLQVSEFAKIFTVIFMCDFLVRRADEIRTSLAGFLKPLMILALIAFMLLLEPDFGATVVIGLACMGVIFMSDAPLVRFVLLTLLVGVLASLVAVLEPYRMKRLTTFVNPWADDVKFDSGYQLTQSLIAFGRGEWSGVGLGNSVQKLFYLPEAHTDFVFSIWAEETGLIGTFIVILLFVVLVMRALIIAKNAMNIRHYFSAYLAIGLALLIAGQAFINIGVTSGLLPTKGLTLPFISYGGSSLLACCIIVGLLLRIGYETSSSEDFAKYQQNNGVATKNRKKTLVKGSGHEKH